jgi:Tol biopolymer transport system component
VPLKALLKIIGIIALLLLGTNIKVYAGWSEPRPVPGINTLSTDYYPSLTSDGSKMYFASTRSGNEDIYVSIRINGAWTTPVNLGAPINSSQRDLCPSISADGRTLYFVTYNRAGGLGSYDIWYSTWNDSTQNWNEPINAGPNINSPAMEWSPSISHDGAKLYFATDDNFKPGWLFGLDIYVSEMGPDGWRPAVSLGDSVNTYDEDYCPSIAADDTTIYFACWESHNLPCWHGPAVDLFVSYFTNGHWGNASNLCDPINTEYWERCPSIGSSGDTLYFARKWPELDTTDNILYSVREPDAIEDDDGQSLLPQEIKIDISPNPFNSSVNIRIESNSDSQNARISISDVTGRRVFEKDIAITNHYASTIWDGTCSLGADATSGVYLVTVRTGRAIQTAKLVKLK